MKQPNHWPDAALPRRLTREWAAFYCGVSPNTFDARVRDSVFPGPDQDGRYDRKLLDLAIDKLNGIAEDMPLPEERWDVPPRPGRAAV